MSKKLTPLSKIIDEISMGPFGSDIKVENFVSSGFPVLNGSNLSGFRLVEEEFKYVNAEKAKTYKKAIARRGDIVITHRGTLGQIVFIPDNSKYDSYVISQSQFRVRVKRDEADPAFLVYYFHTAEGQKRLLSFKNHVGVPALAQATTNFRLLEIPLPNLVIQQKIVSVLSAIDAKIELNNQINAELEKMAKTIYDYWFMQFDFPDENSKPYKSSGGEMIYNHSIKRTIPKNWTDGTLEKLGEIVGGSTPSTTNQQNFSNEGTPWITPNDLSKNRGNKYISNGETDVSPAGIKNASLKIYPKGTVLLSSRAPIGYMAIARNELTTNQGFKSFIPNKSYSSEFIFYSLQNSLRAITQNASGSTFKEISGTTLKTIKVVLPEKKVSDDFTSKIKSIFLRQDLLEQENSELRRLRDWLLPMLMNGQVKVN